MQQLDRYFLRGYINVYGPREDPVMWIKNIRIYCLSKRWRRILL